MEAPKTLRIDTTRKRTRVETAISLLVFHSEGARIVPLAEGRGVVIGRSPPVDVLLPDGTLSRRHARFELSGGEVVVEDLGSTNGTCVEGQRITKQRVRPGMQVTLGDVAVVIHWLRSDDGPLCRLDAHDQFLVKLEQEMVQGHAFGRPLAVMDIEAAQPDIQVSRWYQLIRPCFRPSDTLALYSPRTLEVLLPGASVKDCLDIATQALAQAGGEKPGFDLLFGIAVFPETALSSEQLLQASREALSQANPAAPTKVSETHNVRSRLARPASEQRLPPVILNDRMRELYDSARRLGLQDMPVLIQGETGTGKEVLARTIHENGSRRKHAMCCINCAAIPAQLVESTLFGHEKGSFTGADRTAIGLFEEANGGTILLDEIGELSLSAQATLLRVLETGTVVRVGSTKERQVDVRVVAATNRDLEADCRSGAFRWDLFFRINVMCLQIPPLRERRDEIPALAEYFINHLSPGERGPVTRVDAAAMRRLRDYSWPGNVRELRNVIERGMFVARSGVISVDHLPAKIRLRAEPHDGHMTEDGISLTANINAEAIFGRSRLEQYEVELMREALEKTGHNQTEAARRIGMPLRTFVRKIKKYGLNRRALLR